MNPLRQGQHLYFYSSAEQVAAGMEAARRTLELLIQRQGAPGPTAAAAAATAAEETEEL